MERKAALITGGSSGIGQGIAIVLAEHGYDVAISYGSNAEGAAKTKQAVEAAGGRCEVYQAMMEESDAPERLVRKTHEAFGRLDAMVCNANRDRRHSVLTLTAQDLDYMTKCNYNSYLLCAGAAARRMIRDGMEGSILFITSTHSLRAYADDVVYGSLKASIMRACESIALDLSPYRIRVNCIAPGATNVRPDRPAHRMANPFEKIVPLGRQGTPRENGELAAFLLSDSASYITGTTIRLDGGLILSGPAEGWAPAYQINPLWTRRHYEEMMKNEGDDTHV